MTRRMYDSTSSAGIPEDAEVVAGYVDGDYRWSPADWDRHRGRVLVRIAVFGITDDGDMLDRERGNATWPDAVHWVRLRRQAGKVPVVYCNLSNLIAGVNAFQAAGVPLPGFIVALWDGIAVIRPGWFGKQYADAAMTGGDYDLSVIPDYWPGVDPAPPPPPPPPQEDDEMLVFSVGADPAHPQDNQGIWLMSGGAYFHLMDVPDAGAIIAKIANVGITYTQHVTFLAGSINEAKGLYPYNQTDVQTFLAQEGQTTSAG